MLKIKLSAARINAGYTQKEVAKELHRSPNTIASWESGTTAPRIDELEDLCKLYNISKENIILPYSSTQSEKRCKDEK